MEPTRYTEDDGISVITMDDGKVNALSPAMISSLDAALDRAEAAGAGAVVLAGRPDRFSAGFDLGVLGAGGLEAEGMLRGAFRLAERLLRFPCPVVVACTGHALAMGLFLVCAGDHRVGAAGEFKIQANEVAIGLTMPYPALAILRHRLTPSDLDRAVGLAALYSPETAVTAGLLDEVVPPAQVVDRARAVGRSLAALDRSAHVQSKLRARAGLLRDLDRAITDEFGAEPDGSPTPRPTP